MSNALVEEEASTDGGMDHVPTGVALRDVRAQLFAAAERILVRDGPHALTSRAVTTEAGCAKGVLHRHFADFDDFLVELVRDRIGWLRIRSTTLRDAAGTGTVVGNLTDFLAEVFASVAVAIIALITFRDDLRTRLRADRPTGVPLATDAVEGIAAYLVAERDLARIAAADLDPLAATLVGAGHLQYADRASPAPEPDAVRAVVRSTLADVLRS